MQETMHKNILNGLLWVQFHEQIQFPSYWGILQGITGWKTKVMYRGVKFVLTNIQIITVWHCSQVSLNTYAYTSNTWEKTWVTLSSYIILCGTRRASIGIGIGRCRVRVQFVVTYILHLSQLHCALSELVFNSEASVCKWEVTVDSPVLSHSGHWHFKETFTSERWNTFPFTECVS